MKLALRLTLAIMLWMTLLLGVHGYFVIQREVALFHSDMEMHANLIGEMLKGSAEDLWRTGGLDRILEMVKDANNVEAPMRVRWVYLNGTVDRQFQPILSKEELKAAYEGTDVYVNRRGPDGKKYVFAYFPVHVDGMPLSAVEITQGMGPMYEYIYGTILQKLLLLIGIIAVGGTIVWVLGAAMVGRPVREMVDLAGRVGEGDLEVLLSTTGRPYEMAQLASGLNAMVDRLRETRDRLQRETAKQLETLQQLHHAERLATVGKLASGLAHELGTPLNVVSGRAKMISGQDLTDEQVIESATIIDEQAGRMTNIIKQLLDFARHRRMEKDLVDVNEVITKVFAMMRPMARQRKVSLAYTGEKFPDRIRLDPMQIQQVLSNLIMNAIHAMPNGGVITLQAERKQVTPPPDFSGAEGEYFCLSVTDEGVGIPKEDLSQIFVPFFSTKEVGEGTGLGLSISHGIVSEHGGWIAVESELGKGTTFFIYLPLENKS